MCVWNRNGTQPAFKPLSRFLQVYYVNNNGCSLAYIENTSNLDSNHFVQYCIYLLEGQPLPALCHTL